MHTSYSLAFLRSNPFNAVSLPKDGVVEAAERAVGARALKRRLRFVTDHRCVRQVQAPS